MPKNSLIVLSPESFAPSSPQCDRETYREFLRQASIDARYYHVANQAIIAVYGTVNYIGNYPRSVYDVDGRYPGDEAVVENYTHWLFGQLEIDLPEQQPTVL